MKVVCVCLVGGCLDVDSKEVHSVLAHTRIHTGTLTHTRTHTHTHTHTTNLFTAYVYMYNMKI